MISLLSPFQMGFTIILSYQNKETNGFFVAEQVQKRQQQINEIYKKALE